MKTIYGQIIATTGVDRHGDSIPADKLRILFDKIPDPWIMCDNHDPSKPPTCRSYNKQFVQLENGNWAICCDVDVFDEVAFENYGGFSIAFTVNCHTINPDREPEIDVTINPRLIPVEEFHELVHQSTDELQLDVNDLFQKSLDVPAIIFLSFASGAIAAGFFNSIGEDLYGLLKQKIKKWAGKIEEEHNTELKCNITFNIVRNEQSVQVLVSVKSSDLDILEERGVTEEMILDRINSVAGNDELKKIVVCAQDADPVFFVEYYTDTDGVVHRPTVNEGQIEE